MVVAAGQVEKPDQIKGGGEEVIGRIGGRGPPGRGVADKDGARGVQVEGEDSVAPGSGAGDPSRAVGGDGVGERKPGIRLDGGGGF